MSTGHEWISRAELVRGLGVRRPTLTMWQKRYATFPAPVRHGDRDLFRVDEIIAWLSDRALPADVRSPAEAAGRTYADRLRDHLGPDTEETGGTDDWIGPVVTRLVAARRRLPSAEAYLELVLLLLFVWARHPELWRDIAAADSTVDAIRAARSRWSGPALGDLVEVAPAEVRRIVQECGLPSSPPPGVAGESAAKLADRLVDEVISAEGHLGADRVTPLGLAQLLARAAWPIRPGDHIHDPYCRAGELLSAAVQNPAGGLLDAVLTGEHADASATRLTDFRMALLGELSGLQPANGPSGPDVVVMNPPFNAPGQATNVGWPLRCLELLRKGGRATVLMPNQAAYSTRPAEVSGRAILVDGGALRCVVALPSHLFRGTSIPVLLWLLDTSDEPPSSLRFVDARSVGTMVTRTHRTLSPADVSQVVAVLPGGASSGDPEGLPFVDVARAEVKERGYSVSPAAYLRPDPAPTAPRPDLNTVLSLAADLRFLHSRAEDADERAEELIQRIVQWNS